MAEFCIKLHGNWRSEAVRVYMQPSLEHRLVAARSILESEADEKESVATSVLYMAWKQQAESKEVLSCALFSLNVFPSSCWHQRRGE